MGFIPAKSLATNTDKLTWSIRCWTTAVSAV